MEDEIRDRLLLVKILIESGLEDAQEIFDEEILPFAKLNKISIRDAIRRLADSTSEQDTDSFRLHMALIEMSHENHGKYLNLSINTPLD